MARGTGKKNKASDDAPAFRDDKKLAGFALESAKPLPSEQIHLRTQPCFMQETNGGGSLERVEGFNDFRARNVGLRFYADPALDRATKAGPENVIGNMDSRVAIPDTTALPWRCITYLNITYANGRPATGTAWFVGPQTLATAAHNVLDEHNGSAQVIRVWPAFDGIAAPFGSGVVKRVYHSPHWPKSWSKEDDYAILVLDSAELGSQLGWFGLADFENPPKDLLAQVCGYPADKSPRTQYFNGGRLASWKKKLIEYPFDTEKGMSGAPLWIKRGEERVAIGIHVHGDNAANSARRVTGELYDKLVEYGSIGL